MRRGCMPDFSASQSPRATALRTVELLALTVNGVVTTEKRFLDAVCPQANGATFKFVWEQGSVMKSERA